LTSVACRPQPVALFARPANDYSYRPQGAAVASLGLVSVAPDSPQLFRLRPGALIVGLLLAGYFGAWALLRPPLQTPDEPQHLLKATSIALQPWVGPPGRFALDAARANPLALDTPAGLDKLFFRPFNAMSAGDIAEARQVRWYDAGRTLADYERAIASYPTPYYLALYACAEPVTRAFGLSPYQATYAYRLVSAALAAALWALVWAVLTRIPELRPGAGAVFALAVLNPMLAFMSSAVNPDAVNNPLCALALLLVWCVVRPGGEADVTRSQWIAAAFGALILAMLTKPSGLQIVPALLLVLPVLAMARRITWRRGVMALGAAAAAATVAVVAFYLWSPPRFMAGGPSADSLRLFVEYRIAHIGLAWRMYWGQLGWLDYHAGFTSYWLVAAAVSTNLACIVWRPDSWQSAGWYLGLSWIAFAVVTFAGEYWYLREAGYTFQGRYLFPASIGAGALFCHRVPAARYGLLAMLAALNLVLAQATVTRYFVDGWSGVWQSLP
jgi:hypothetical protein